jgi:hypothetical protein
MGAQRVDSLMNLVSHSVYDVGTSIILVDRSCISHSFEEVLVIDITTRGESLSNVHGLSRLKSVSCYVKESIDEVISLQGAALGLVLGSKLVFKCVKNSCACYLTKSIRIKSCTCIFVIYSTRGIISESTLVVRKRL